MTTLPNEGPTVGMLVMSSDGDELGRVKAIRGNCFKIDAALQVDYWLTTDTIADTSTGVVMLKFPKDFLNQQAPGDSGHTGVHFHFGAEDSD